MKTKSLAGALAVLSLILLAPRATIRAAVTLPAGFTDSVVLSGLTTPTVMAFSPDGRVFVGEKSGLVKVFDSLDDPTPSVFADLRTQVYNYGDRGLLGLALDPGFPTKPYVYVLYTRDASIGGTAPRWGTAGATGDPCPNAADVGCPASGRLSRLQASGSSWTGTEQVLIDDWFQQFESHSMGSIAFGEDGALYASGGDAASWQFVDYGQAGNPGGDPPNEGGALRAQDLRTSGDPVGLNGTVIRVNRDTGAALSDNPLFSHADPKARRIVGYGLRNPFRIALRPGTRELWVGDVGWQLYEELNVIPDPTAVVVPNFGWPCFDGTRRQPGYDAANLPICEGLYAEASMTRSYFQYQENFPVVDGETCANTDQSLSGIAFYEGGAYPAKYDRALFFADYTRRCIWMMPAGADGRPVTAAREVFAAQASYPVDLKVGPGGDLFYVDIASGTIHRISFSGGNRAPVAEFAASPTAGPAPLTAAFDAAGSSDPDGGTLTYAWDLDGDGAFDDGTSRTIAYTYTVNGSYTARLRVRDQDGLVDDASRVITVGSRAPVAVIDTPAASLKWSTGQSVSFSGHASDAEDGILPASALKWVTILNHCSTATSCHQHPLQAYDGVSAGTFAGPDHEYPSFVTLRLSATDSSGLTHTVERRLDPLALTITLATEPTGLRVVFGSRALTAPTQVTVIAGSHHTIAAESPQTIGGVSYNFASWSDGGARSHTITASTARTYTARFTSTGTTALPAGWSGGDVGAVGATGSSSASGGIFTVTGAGADIWSTADEFHFTRLTLTGDFSIAARVASVQNVHAWTKAGLMLREGTLPGARHALILATPTAVKGVAFQRRPTAGGASVSTAGPLVGPPGWLRLERAGNLVRAFWRAQAADAWTAVGTQTFTGLGASLEVGFAVSSHVDATRATATFDNLTIDQPFASSDIGSVGVSGGTSVSGGTITIRGSGADIWGTADAFRFHARRWTGDGTIIVRVASVQNTNAWAKAGVMFRESLAPNARHVMAVVSPGKGVAMQYRASAGSSSINAALRAGTAPEWVRLKRAGNTFTASVSDDGVTWHSLGSATVSMGASVYVGLPVTSHANTVTATAVFDNLSVKN